MSPIRWAPSAVAKTSWAFESSVAKKWRALWACISASLVSTGEEPLGSR